MFKEILQPLVEETEGGVGAILIGYDGIPVEQFVKPNGGLNLGLVAVELVSALKEVKKAVALLQLGGLEEVSLKTRSFQILVRTLDENYFVALAIGDKGNLGKGRYLMTRDRIKILDALS
jgi:predicted regulator of Ras-like GTPase activity (Roadblock/LC7/MglB family)